MGDGRRFYTTAQVGEMFGVTAYTVREWLKDPEHPLVGSKLKGGGWRVRVTEAERYAQEIYGGTK